MKYYISIVIVVLLSLSLNAQDHEVEGNQEEHQHQKKFSHGAAFSYGIIALPQFDIEGDHIGEVYLPAVSLDYALWYKRKFGVVLLNEFVLSSFIVHDGHGDFIEREQILITSIALAYSPFKNAAGFIGAGLETDLGNGVSFSILKMGLEYSIPIRNGWSSVILLSGDFREYYGSASFEIGFAKHF